MLVLNLHLPAPPPPPPPSRSALEVWHLQRPFLLGAAGLAAVAGGEAQGPQADSGHNFHSTLWRMKASKAEGLSPGGSFPLIWFYANSKTLPKDKAMVEPTKTEIHARF